MSSDRSVCPADVNALRQVFKRRADGVPVQYLTGVEGFMGLDFHVAPGVLIPRQDTETLVEKIIERVKGRTNLRILDIGTGSGAIAISLAYYLKTAQVEAVDISETAIAIARSNAQKHGVARRVTCLNGDLFKGIVAVYDVIVSNPPYIPTEEIASLQVEVAHYEPRLALDGGRDGYAFYRKIIDEAPTRLKKEGILAFETGHDQAQTVAGFMEESGCYRNMCIYRDLTGIERVVMGFK